ncbi:MAG: T9SS type A sorting domain-containing protein [Bacteroidota bacterium]
MFNIRILLVFLASSLCCSLMAQISLLSNLNQSGGGANSSAPRAWVALDENRFVFGAAGPISTGIFPARAWVSDGTEEGTFRLSDIEVAREFIQLGNIVLFNGSGSEGRELWRTDGTEEGTVLVKDIHPDGWSEPSDFRRLGDQVIFAAETEELGRELWITDGTEEGTELLLDVFPGPNDGYDGEATVIDDSLLFFRGIDMADNTEPWRTNGTAAGSWKIAEVNPEEFGSGPAFFTKSGDWIYYSALAEGSGRELHRTSGQQGSDQIIGEGDGTTDSSNPFELTDLNGQLFFVADGIAPAGNELWTYNHQGEPIVISGETPIFPQELYALGDILIFSATSAGSGRELWTSDGTASGTQQLIDLYPGDFDGIFSGCDASCFAVVDGIFYFAGADGATSGSGGLELFQTDGTAQGTQIVADFVSGPNGSGPAYFFPFGDRLYFAATDGIVGNEPHYIGLPAPNSIGPIVQPEFNLYPPFPNPIDGAQTINFRISLHTANTIEVQLFDPLGRLVEQMAPAFYPVGEHQIRIQAQQELAAGSYQLVIKTASQAATFSILIQ